MAPSTNSRPERSDRPYNTRRKSLSLHSLGIHVPVTHAARAAAAANRASSSSSSSSNSSSSSTSVNMASQASHNTKDEQSSIKRLKRTHSQADGDAQVQPSSKRRNSASNKLKDTPPPSPPASVQSIEMDDDESSIPRTIDMESINDEIVEAVIIQLQETGNRPHLVKELAAVLMQQLKIVQQSANPCAIISSRLATYLKRSGWSAQSPCPLAKELESVHPRRTYFYLTTCPHQPLPDPSQAATLGSLAHSRAVISPSLSSAASNSEDADIEDNIRRRELSPSPEVDLSSPEFDEMDDDMPRTPIGSFSMHDGFFPPRHSHHHNHSNNGRSNSRRAASPPLEKDEKEFTQTADGLQKRKLNGGDLLKGNAPTEQAPTTVADLERDESSLFGGTSNTSAALSVPTPMPFASSPAIRASSTFYPRKESLPEVESWNKWDSMLEWDRNPENIELDELDGLLSDY
ncbi:hypothetical protein QBC35DRAFT_54467 [Podospora australis]|uniref:GDS1 winged helix domain-containing protein n=1 Tax=Podospora australis TaxID=1536484 RepID=A0AAN6WZZ2_9PEZI|nr:hypothetical protein QBC35DRAFT_54467 [Podospora australis]